MKITRKSKPAIAQIQISSFQEFTLFVEKEITEDRVLFRGQRQDFPLIPKVGRINPPGKILKAEKEDADKCITTPCTHGVFEVRLGNSGYDVNTSRRTCTCGKWQITGIPCEHAYGAMIDAGLDVEDYISEFFSTSLWKMTYNQSINKCHLKQALEEV